MLLGNVSQFNANGIRNNGAFGDRYTNFKPSVWFNVNYNEVYGYKKTLSFPTGTQPPYSFGLPLKGGEMSATTNIGGVGSFIGSLTMGKVMTANIAGVGDLTASMSLITSMAATLAGTGALSGTMKLTIAMAANLAGQGDLAGAMSLLIPLAANLSGTGSITANLKGNADLAAHIYVNSGTASTQELVAAIWSAMASDYNESGTMGEKMNAAGTAGDPWTADLSGYNTDDTAGKILKQAKAKASLAASLSA